MGGGTRRLGVVVIVSALVGFADIAVAEESKAPSAKRVARTAVKALGPDAIPAVLLAFDQGYSAGQLVEGVQERTLEFTGAIIDESGQQVDPAGSPAGAITGASPSQLPGDDLSGPISLETIREAVPDDKPEKVLVLSTIVLGAALGYPIEDLIVALIDEQFTPFGAITGLPKPKVPDPDLLDALLTDLEKANNDAPKKESKTSYKDGNEADGNVAGRFEGAFTGRLFEQYLAVSYPGGPRPIRNRVDMTITDKGLLRFSLALVIRAAWVSEDDTVTCEARQDFFSVPVRPTAKLQDDGTFESSRFTAVIRETDFSGPECASHPYEGENDEDLTDLVLVGSVEGDTLRGHIPFESESESFRLQFQATRQ